MSELLLVRHCESTDPAPDSHLTEAGFNQADQLAGYLAQFPIHAIICSPYRRAQETIAPLAGSSGIAIETDDRLAERRLSFQPRKRYRELVRMAFEKPKAIVPEGESARDALDRGWAALEDAFAAAGLPVLVSHGQLISLILHKIDPSFGFSGWEALSTPDVFLLTEREPGGYEFKRVWT